MATPKNKNNEVKTDNSFLADKVGLRVAHLPKSKIVTVLDCFAGTGRVWRAVKSRTKRDIRILAMERREIGFRLPGDNLTWLMDMDLSRFNVVDLDAYGVPYDQMRLLFERGYKGTVFVTFIQSMWGRMPKGLLLDIGFSEEIIQKAPALCSARGFQYVMEWLASKGVEKIYRRSHVRKHYFCFTMI